MNGMLNVKTINKFDHAPFISSVDHWPFPRWNVNKLYILSTFGNISLPFHEVHLKEGQPWTTLLNHGQLFDVNQNLLARALKIYFHRLLFFHSPYIEQPRNFLLSQKQLYIPLLFPSHVFNSALTDWLIFLSLMKLCLACVKQNTTIKTTRDACSLLAKQTSSEFIQRQSLLIINFEQVIRPFLVWSFYFTFFLPVVDCTFYKSTIKSNFMFLSYHVRVSEWIYTL